MSKEQLNKMSKTYEAYKDTASAILGSFLILVFVALMLNLMLKIQ